MSPQLFFLSALSFNKRSIISLLIFCILITQSGCKKFIDVSPPVTSLTGASVFTTDANAIAVLTGLYSGIISSSDLSTGFTSMSLFPALSSDELSLFETSNATYAPYYTNNLNSLANGDIYWNTIYPMLFTINSAISGLSATNSLTPAVRQQLLGEAKFMRAFCYFYLTNLYGDVPLVTDIDYNVNSKLSRTVQTKVYEQVIADLKDAQRLLSVNYLDASLLKSTVERVRPTKWAAVALLARAYLYTGDWVDAELESDSVIKMTSVFKLDSLGGVFLRNHPEAIWQLQPVISGYNSPAGPFFTLPASGPGINFPVYLNNTLANSFESGDMRKQKWTGNVTVGSVTFYYPSKYKVNTPTTPPQEYETVLRLGEQYLIRSEARAHQNKLTDAINDLDTIRARAGLASVDSLTTQSAVLNTIYHERQVELFTEWGHRWLDLKRTGLIDAIMNIVTPQKGGVWASYKKWYPIPFTEIKNDANLAQNEGY